ncbi:MAG: AraC family transcriptional regulator [Bacteroidota bacterium]
MKVLPFKIPKPKNEALVYQVDREHVFYNQLHQHGEIQISFVEKGFGSLVVGDTISEYKENDILVIGGFLPHVFRSEPKATNQSVMCTLFFDKDAFGETFFDIPDLASLEGFFQKSKHGIKVLSNKNAIIALFNSLSKQNKVEQVATLLLVLNLISNAKTTPLSSFVYKKMYSDDEGKRMGDVFRFAMEKFQEPITLDQVSDVANMSKNAFCRYFKKRTNKTFFQFLIEIRVEQASKHISSGAEQSISLIAEGCGFKNMANFNRKFKQIKGCTPSQYRAKF